MDPSTVINSDGWRGYGGLVDLGYGHFRVDHSKNEFTRGAVHINGIEGFRGLAKVRLTKFKSLPRHTFLCISRKPNGAIDMLTSSIPSTKPAQLEHNPLNLPRLFASLDLLQDFNVDDCSATKSGALHFKPERA